MRGSKADLPKTVDVEELTIHEVDWGDMHVNLVTCHKVLDMGPLLKDYQTIGASASTGG